MYTEEQLPPPTLPEQPDPPNPLPKNVDANAAKFAVTNSAAFATAFAQDFDLTAAAEQAGVSVAEAAEILHESRMRERIEEKIMARRAGETLARIRREYERIAFHDDEDAKPGDRLRALEQLRLIASSERGDGAAPSLVIRCEYV